MSRKPRKLVPAKKVGFIRAAKRMYRDPSISGKQKLILLIGSWYWAVPEPTDLVPLIGWLDEVGVTGTFTILLVIARGRYRNRQAIRTTK